MFAVSYSVMSLFCCLLSIGGVNSSSSKGRFGVEHIEWTRIQNECRFLGDSSLAGLVSVEMKELGRLVVNTFE